jgi:G3E family GTPase
MKTADPLAGKIPVSVITGFLGSGKTTLIQKLLRHPGMNRAAVIINEFGEQAIDHDLVANSTESMTLLDNGCLCCTLRSDLQETLREMFIKRRNGEVIDFDRVIIETSGLADPAPVMHTLMTDTLVADFYRLDCVVTLVDGVNGVEQLATLAEPVKQAAVADRLLVTKGDLISEAAYEALVRRLRDFNATAPIHRVLHGEIDPAQLFNVGIARTTAAGSDVERWLADQPAGDGLSFRAPSGLTQASHTAGVTSFCLYFDEPFDWKVFTQCMELLATLRGPDLLRVKGLVNVAGETGPVVVQGVQHLFHPPLTLAAWPSDDRRTRLVFITRGIRRETVANLFGAVTAITPA